MKMPEPVIIGEREFSRYTVCAAFGCRIVHGEIPVSEIPSLVHGYSAAAWHDMAVAQKLNATLAIGEPPDMANLRQALHIDPPT